MFVVRDHTGAPTVPAGYRVVTSLPQKGDLVAKLRVKSQRINTLTTMYWRELTSDPLPVLRKNTVYIRREKTA